MALGLRRVASSEIYLLVDLCRHVPYAVRMRSWLLVTVLTSSLVVVLTSYPYLHYPGAGLELAVPVRRDRGDDVAVPLGHGVGRRRPSRWKKHAYQLLSG